MFRACLENSKLYLQKKDNKTVCQLRHWCQQLYGAVNKLLSGNNNRLYHKTVKFENDALTFGIPQISLFRYITCTVLWINFSISWKLMSWISSKNFMPLPRYRKFTSAIFYFGPPCTYTMMKRLKSSAWIKHKLFWRFQRHNRDTVLLFHVVKDYHQSDVQIWTAD